VRDAVRVDGGPRLRSGAEPEERIDQELDPRASAALGDLAGRVSRAEAVAALTLVDPYAQLAPIVALETEALGLASLAPALPALRLPWRVGPAIFAPAVVLGACASSSTRGISAAPGPRPRREP